MANKKCPKCGEDNPAEAVMCWACYTPLTAGAGAQMGAGAQSGATTFPRSGALPGAGMGAGAPATNENDKKQVDPRLFFVGGGLLLAGLVGAFTTGLFGGKSNVDDVLPPPVEANVSSNFTTTGSSSVAPPRPSFSGGGGGGGGGQTQPPPVAPVPYSMVVPPNARFTTATLAITPTGSFASAGEAAGLARKARQNLQQGGRWTNFQIAVFTDSASAKAFASYMNARRGAPLNSQNYAELAGQNAWQGAAVYYEASGNKEHVSNPSANPGSWWGGSR